jgi:hypothetical protein
MVGGPVVRLLADLEVVMSNIDRQFYESYASQARSVLVELHTLADQVFLYTDGGDPAADAHDEFAIAMADVKDAFWKLIVPEERNDA